MNRLLFSDNRGNRDDNRLQLFLASTWAEHLVVPVAMPSGAMTVSGSNYQVTLPASASAQFYRLSL